MSVRNTNGLGAAFANAEEATEKARLENATAKLAAAGLLPVSAGEILAREYPPVEWIIEDLLATRGNTSRGFKGDIIAGSKMRKTFFALMLAADISAGRDFLKSERFAGFKVPKPRKVLYLNLELREDFAQERLRHLNADPHNLMLMTPARPYLLRNKCDQNGKKVEGFEDELISYMNCTGVELMIADPQYKLEFPEEDENSGQGIGGILRWRDRIITETGAACVIVHHDPKSGGTDRDLTTRGAGSSFAGRDYDARFALDAHADGDPTHEVLECGSRVRKDPEAVTIVFDTAELTFKGDGTIKAKRLSGEDKKRKSKNETTSDAARMERERTKAAALKMFEDIAVAVVEKARKQGLEPTPESFLLNVTAFQSYLRERAGIGVNASKDQQKILLGATAGVPAILASVHELELKGGKVQNKSGGVTYIGLPARVEAYRKSFEEKIG